MPTMEDRLCQVYAFGHWQHMGLAKDKRPYGPGTFTKHHWANLLQKNARSTTLKLIRQESCLVCGEHISVNTRAKGDHLIATHKGGKNAAFNYLPLCGRCNASKGTKDFIDWWIKKDLFIPPPKEALIVYAQLAWQHTLADDLHDDAPPYLHLFCRRLAETLPTANHRTLFLDIRANGFHSSIQFAISQDTPAPRLS